MLLRSRGHIILSVFKGFKFWETIFRPLHRPLGSYVHMQAQPLPHAHAHTDGPKHTYLQSIKNVEVCFHCPVWLTER